MAKKIEVSASEYDWLKQENRELSLQVLQLGGENEQLKRENANLVGKLEAAEGLCRKREQAIDELNAELEKVKRERDAAVKDIPRACGYCKNYIVGEHIPHCHVECLNISGVNTGWEWRGLEEKEQQK